MTDAEKEPDKPKDESAEGAEVIPVDPEPPVEYTPEHDSHLYPKLIDVAGPKKFKRELEDIVNGIRHPDLYKLLGVEPRKSFLFSGPPGTGKTFSYKAIRNELTSLHEAVIEFKYDIGNYGTAYINMGSVQLQKFFDHGRKKAHQGATVMYWFDEADVLMGHRRAGSRSHKEDDKLLDTLMKNLQEISTHGTNEYVFFATNFREGMDEAAIRSKRIDDIVNFPMPNMEGLRNAYVMKIAYFNNQTISGYRVLRGCKSEELARESNGFSYADVEAVIESSIRNKAKRFLRRSMETEKDVIIKAPYVSHKDLLQEIYKMRDGKHERSGRIGFK